MTWPIFGDHEVKLQAIHRLVQSADDIVTAVIGGALLEEAVERTLRERMRDNPKAGAALFRLGGPLSDVATQINTLYMLCGIDEAARESMKGIARVRNRFAHELTVTFDSTEKDLSKAFGLMTLHEAYTHYPDARFGTPTSKNVEEVTTNRERFIVNLKLCLNLLMQDRCRHDAHSTKPLSYEELKKRVGKPHS